MFRTFSKSSSKKPSKLVEKLIRKHDQASLEALSALCTKENVLNLITILDSLEKEQIKFIKNKHSPLEYEQKIDQIEFIMGRIREENSRIPQHCLDKLNEIKSTYEEQNEIKNASRP